MSDTVVIQWQKHVSILYPHQYDDSWRRGTEEPSISSGLVALAEQAHVFRNITYPQTLRGRSLRLLVNKVGDCDLLHSLGMDRSQETRREDSSF
jgi:hypothetical protein